MKTVDVLRKALRVIKNPDKWIQQCYAEDKKGNEVEPKDKKAVKFCSLGAIQRVAERKTDETRAIKQLTKFTGGEQVYMFNDSRNHKEVVELFKTAIAAKEKE